MTGGPDLVEVQILGLPVPLWQRAQEHSDELLREFALIAANQQQRGEQHVPARLTRLVEDLTTEYGGFSGAQEAALNQAAHDGVASLDLVYTLPVAAAGAAAHLGDLMDQADEYCQAGRHLLTLATPAELIRFRRWFLEQFIEQAAGQPAVPWAAWRERVAAGS